MTTKDARWRLELQTEAPYNPEQWVELRDSDGKRYRFIERSEAETEMERFLKYQPQLRGNPPSAPARLRIVAI